MQRTKRYLISISGFAVFIFFGYLAFQDSNSPQSGETTIVSQSGTNTVGNTGKQLAAVPHSENQWRTSPFGSGKQEHSLESHTSLVKGIRRK